MHVDPHGCADESQLLGAHPGAYLQVPASDEERVQCAVGLVELRSICEVVYHHQHLVELLHLQLLASIRDLTLLLDDASQRRFIPFVPVRLLALSVHPQILFDIFPDWNPAVVDVDTGTEDVDPFKDSAILLQNQADQRYSLARLAWAEEDSRAWHLRYHRV